MLYNIRQINASQPETETAHIPCLRSKQSLTVLTSYITCGFRKKQFLFQNIKFQYLEKLRSNPFMLIYQLGCVIVSTRLLKHDMFSVYNEYINQAYKFCISYRWQDALLSMSVLRIFVECLSSLPFRHKLL